MSARLGCRITDDMIEQLRQRIGIARPIPYPYNTEASCDAIRHFAHGIGDLNPLWQDVDYAAGTRWGGIIAPRARERALGARRWDWLQTSFSIGARPEVLLASYGNVPHG